VAGYGHETLAILSPMDLPDQELVQRLALRDGPMRERFVSHRARGRCRYADANPEGCPWCAAEERRLQRELSNVANASVEDASLK
jgi:hypothetical protein